MMDNAAELYFKDMEEKRYKELELLKEDSSMAKFLIEDGYLEKIENVNTKTYTKSINDMLNICFYRESFVHSFYGKGSESVYRTWGARIKIRNSLELDIHLGNDKEKEFFFNVHIMENMFRIIAKGLKSVETK